MCEISSTKTKNCELESVTHINSETFILSFNWTGEPPKAGQFFMIKPERTSVFLPRPISIFDYCASSKSLKFLIAKNGTGTKEMSCLQAGENVLLTGPLGNFWENFLPENGKVALVGGSAGIAPLAALVNEKPDYNFHFFAGLKTGFNSKEEENTFLGSAVFAKKIVITSEDGRNAYHGRIIDYLYEPESFDCILGCGSSLMLKALKKKCDVKNIPCFLSMESRMACGVGACLGCTVNTVKGNRRCCCDGPIFSSGDIIFDE